jgi:hypothetical protein
MTSGDNLRDLGGTEPVPSDCFDKKLLFKLLEFQGK